MVEILDEGEIVGLEILHAAAHAGKTFAETEVVGGIGVQHGGQFRCAEGIEKTVGSVGVWDCGAEIIAA